MTTRLPPELVVAIASLIDKRVDLFALVLTCKSYATLLKTQLEYFHIRVVPEDELGLWELLAKDKFLAQSVRVLELVAHQHDTLVSLYYGLPRNPPLRIPPGITEKPLDPSLEDDDDEEDEDEDDVDEDVDETAEEDVLTDLVLSAIKNMANLTTFNYSALVDQFNESFCEGLWSTLSRCQSLRSVTLREVAEDLTGLWHHSEFYSLKNLTSITYSPLMYPENGNDGCDFIDMLVQNPALEVLNVVCYGLEHQDGDLDLNGLYELHLPALRKVTLGASYDAEPESIIEFLANHPSIEVLSLNGLELLDEGGDAIKLPRGFLPNIREILGADEFAQAVVQRKAKTEARLKLGHDDDSDSDVEDEDEDEDEGEEESEDEDEDEGEGEKEEAD